MREDVRATENLGRKTVGKSRITTPGIALTTAVILGVAGCTKYEISDHSYQYNEAIGSLGNRVLLLNAARAAKNYPMQFSKISNYTGGGRVNGALAVDVPQPHRIFGDPTSVVSTTYKPSVNVGSGVTTLQIADLDTAEAQKKLKTPVSGAQLAYYFTQGWTPRVVISTTLETIEVTKEVYEEFRKNYQEVCDLDPNSPLCWIEQTEHAWCIEDQKFAGIPHWHDKTIYGARNNPRLVCEYYRFQWFLEAMQASGMIIDSNPAERVPIKQDDAGKGMKTVAEGKLEDSTNFTIDVNLKVPKKKAEKNSTVTPAIDYTTKKMKQFMFESSAPVLDVRRTKNGDAEFVQFVVRSIKFETRSPERMVRYLGDLIAAQSLLSSRYVPQVRVGQTEQVPLFVVRTGGGGQVRSTVSVLDPERQRVSIPIPKYSSAARHRSMEVLSLVMDVMNSAVSGQDLPPPSTFVLAGN